MPRDVLPEVAAWWRAAAPLDIDRLAPKMLDSSRPAMRFLRVRLRDITRDFAESERDADMSTYMPKPGEIQGNWHVVDATNQVLGRLAARIAVILQGKHKPTYTPFIDVGDFVVIVNAAKVKLTGRKEDQKIYRQHSGYEGGLRETRARVVRQRHPERIVEDAVHGMLPKKKLGQAMYRKLKVYAAADHPHAAQKPTKLEVA
jgi:large subunit ribosomal protein L13